MKNILKLMTISMMFFLTISLQSEGTGKKVPSVKVKSMKDGKIVDASTFSNDGKPIIINFWATWCKPCIKELNNIHEVYPDWIEESGVKLIAISIDDSRNAKRVAPFVKGRGWEYEVYLDENSDLRRAMNVTNPPHTFLLDGEGNIVFQHNGYAPGQEEELYEKVLELIEE